jgi:hypothetical protein
VSRSFAFNPMLAERIRKAEAQKSALTPMQRDAYDALKRGPLYRVKGSSGFQARGTRRFLEQSLRPLVNMGFVQFDPNLGPAGALIIREQNS